MAEPNPLERLADTVPPPLNVPFTLAGALAADAELLLDRSDRGPLDDRDPDYIRRTLPLFNRAVQAYFRGEVRGLERIPKKGAALLVGNHSGGNFIADTFVFSYAFYDRFGADRPFFQLAHDLVLRVPLLTFLRKYGVLAASHENAHAALGAGAALLVYPGGDFESHRPSWHSDQVEFGGRRGYVKLALETGVPIVPIVSIGGQETALFLTRGERLAKGLGLDRLARLKVLPITIGPPFGINVLDVPGRIPLPAKITIEVHEPIDLKERFGPEPDVDEVAETIEAEMQETLDRLSEERTLPVVG